MKLNIWKKLSLSWNCLVENWKSYVGTGIVYGLIAILVGIFWFGVLFIWVKNVITWWFGGWVLFWLGIALLLVASRLGKALLFVSSFYITKSYAENKKLNFKEAFKKWLTELKYKVLIDLWYFVIGFLAILWFAILIGLWWLLASISDIWQAILLVLILVGTYFLIKICLMFFLSDYYCFDNRKFDFKTFLESRKLVKWKYWYLILNIIALFLVIFVVSFVVMLPLQPLNPNINLLKDNSLYWFQMTVLWLFTIGTVIYYAVSYIVWLLLQIYSFIYFFFVYEEIKKDSKSDEEEKENPAN